MPETGRASLSDRLTSMAVCCAVVAAICTGGASVEASAQITSVPRHSYRATDLETLRERFSQPPGEAGPWVYWMWFDNVVSKAEITRELEEMAAAGIAGAELRCLVARGFPGLTEPWYGPDSWARLGHQRLKYLSPEFVDALAHTCAEAERCGVKLATNLGMGWPPGGPWITNEHRSKHLQAASRIVAGPKPLALGAVTVPADAMAFAWKIDTAAKGNRVMPQSFRDLTGNVDAEHQLSWDVPEGKWLIGIFHCTYGGICDKGNGPEADPGSREAERIGKNASDQSNSDGDIAVCRVGPLGFVRRDLEIQGDAYQEGILTRPEFAFRAATEELPGELHVHILGYGPIKAGDHHPAAGLGIEQGGGVGPPQK